MAASARSSSTKLLAATPTLFTDDSPESHFLAAHRHRTLSSSRTPVYLLPSSKHRAKEPCCERPPVTIESDSISSIGCTTYDRAQTESDRFAIERERRQPALRLTFCSKNGAEIPADSNAPSVFEPSRNPWIAIDGTRGATNLPIPPRNESCF